MDSVQKKFWRWSDGRLGDVGMDGLRWTARRNGRLGNGWLGDGRLGDKALDSLAIKRWTALRCRDGQLAMDGLAMERWTAR